MSDRTEEVFLAVAEAPLRNTITISLTRRLEEELLSKGVLSSLVDMLISKARGKA